MRISRQTLFGPGSTPWIPVSYPQPNFNVALGVLPSEAATGLVCEAHYTMDDQSVWRVVNWSQVATLVTIQDGIQTYGSSGTTLNPHGLVSGDSISISGSGASARDGSFVNFDGNYDVTVTSPTTYTINVTPNQTAAGSSFVIPQRWQITTAIPTGTSTRLFANSHQPATAYRLVVSVLTAGTVDFLVLQGLGS